MHRSLLLACAAGCAVTVCAAADDGMERLRLFDDFSPGWRDRWREQSLFAKPTRYDVVTEAGQPVLHAVSRAANAGLVREVKRPAPAEARLHWRWKVRSALVGNTRERERTGDDYAARVFVVFETSVNPFRTRAINYVWAATEKTGAVYASPYAKNVGIIVLRSGAAEAGVWQAEHRDVLADYRAFFGEPPTTIGAVAVSVDTDNTKGDAEAWFGDLVLEAKPTRAGEKRP